MAKRDEKRNLRGRAGVNGVDGDGWRRDRGITRDRQARDGERAGDEVPAGEEAPEALVTGGVVSGVHSRVVLGEEGGSFSRGELVEDDLRVPRVRLLVERLGNHGDECRRLCILK